MRDHASSEAILTGRITCFHFSTLTAQPGVPTSSSAALKKNMFNARFRLRNTDGALTVWRSKGGVCFSAARDYFGGTNKQKNKLKNPQQHHTNCTTRENQLSKWRVSRNIEVASRKNPFQKIRTRWPLDHKRKNHGH